MVHRDIRSVSKRLASQSVCPRGRSSGPQAPALTIAERSVNNSLTGYRKVAAGRGGTLPVPRWAGAADPKLRYAALNQM
jgi:hypothetical protein